MKSQRSKDNRARRRALRLAHRETEQVIRGFARMTSVWFGRDPRDARAFARRALGAMNTRSPNWGTVMAEAGYLPAAITVRFVGDE